MDKKTLGIVSYITLIGWIIAFVKNNPKDEDAAFHIRQSLGIMLISLVLYIPFMIIVMIMPAMFFLIYIPYLAIIALWVLGLISAINEDKKPVPVVGEKIQDILKSI